MLFVKLAELLYVLCGWAASAVLQRWKNDVC